jgi:hypothetical protein
MIIFVIMFMSNLVPLMLTSFRLVKEMNKIVLLIFPPIHRVYAYKLYNSQVNYLCPLDWAKGAQVASKTLCLGIPLRVILEELSVVSVQCVKKNCPLWHECRNCAILLGPE